MFKNLFSKGLKFLRLQGGYHKFSYSYPYDLVVSLIYFPNGPAHITMYNC